MKYPPKIGRYCNQVKEVFYNYYGRGKVHVKEEFVNSRDISLYLDVNYGDFDVEDGMMSHTVRGAWIRYHFVIRETYMQFREPLFFRTLFTKEERDSRYNHSHIDGTDSFNFFCLGDTHLNNMTNQVNHYLYKYTPRPYDVRDKVEEFLVTVDNFLSQENVEDAYRHISNIGPVITSPEITDAYITGLIQDILRSEDIEFQVFFSGDSLIIKDISEELIDKINELIPEDERWIIVADRHVKKKDYFEALNSIVPEDNIETIDVGGLERTVDGIVLKQRAYNSYLSIEHQGEPTEVVHPHIVNKLQSLLEKLKTYYIYESNKKENINSSITPETTADPIEGTSIPDNILS